MTTTTTTPVVEEARARAFLDDAERVAVIGASDAKESFGRAIVEELRSHGRDAVAVHPTATTVAGQPAHASVADVPGPVDLAIVMVPAAAAAGVVHECAAAGIRRVWLFKGIGGAGSVSPEALAACEEHGLEVVAGACPLMFLAPVGFVHRVHRSVRRARGALARTA